MLVQRVSVSPSVRLAAAICVVHSLAAVLLWLVPLPAPGKAVITLAISVSLVFFLARDAALHAANSIIALEIRENGTVSYRARGGEWVDCELLGSSFVSPRLTIVNLRPVGRRRTRRVIVVPDNVDPRDFRRLRLWLRWKRGDRPESVQIVER
jgi:toxin CptA